MITFTQAELNSVGEMAQHVDKDKLQIAISEAVRFDMPSLLGHFWDDVETNWGATAAPWTELIAGSEFVCKEKTIKHLGVKEVLKYFVYARYLMLNGWNDTPNGHVSKTNPFSVPKPLKEVESFSARYRGMGKSIFNEVYSYLCVNKDLTEYENFESKKCQACGCFDEKSGLHTGFGFKSKTISRWD